MPHLCENDKKRGLKTFSEVGKMIEMLIFIIIVGFLAQLIDGTLGMAYGVTSNSFLLSLGFAPAVASATVHTAEIFTTLASGLSHLKLGNVDKKLFVNLALPGSLTAVVGAYLLVNFPTGMVKDLVAVYLVLMGGVIILRAFGRNVFFRKVNVRLLAGIGGLIDAVGGGGWGPVVTSTLVANGEDPKRAIGSVNLSEFLVTITQSATFFMLLGFVKPETVIALLIGGVAAAPLAAYLCRKAPTKTLLVLVGLLIVILNFKTLLT
jgi:uncharacterized membrane protein YfcA